MKDPDNRLLSRGPRSGSMTEMLRDQALFVSGLMVQKLGGPSVKPPQPSGLWEAVAYPAATRELRPDAARESASPQPVHFLETTAPPPQMNTLDAPSREACLVAANAPTRRCKRCCS